MVSTHRIRRRDWQLLLIILFIAAWMRFGMGGVVEFFHDDAMLASLAQDMIAGEAVYFTGINSSVGVPNPPTSVYMMVLPFALDSNPMTAIYFIMAWNVVGVGLLWLLAHRYFGRTVALVAGLAYAVSPWAVLYSRKIWAQDFHTPFVLIGLLLALYGFLEDSARDSKTRLGAQIFALPILIYGLQIHFAAWALLPVYVVIVMMGRTSVDWRAVVASFVLTVLTLIPYGIGFVDALQANPERLTEAASTSSAADGVALSLTPFVQTFNLTTGLGMASWIAPSQQDLMNAVVPPISLWWIIGLLMLGGVGLLYRQINRPFAWILLVWTFFPAFLLMSGLSDSYHHYFVASIPALMILVGIAVAQIAQIVPVQPYGRSIILLAFVGILLTQVVYFRGVLRFVDQTPIEYLGFTIPLHYLETIEDELADYDDVVVLSDGMAWDLNHESVVWDVMLADDATCVRTLRGDGYAVFPDGGFAALQAPNMPLDGIGQLYQNESATTFPTRGDSETYIVYAWDESPQWTGAPITAIDAATFDSGVQLTGYSLENNQLTLEWRLPQRTDGLDYQFSGQLVDADGNRLVQRDKRFWHGRHWCAGDRLLTWVGLDEIPSDAAQLVVSLYQLGGANEPAFINANVLDVAGKPQGQYVTIELPD